MTEISKSPEQASQEAMEMLKTDPITIITAHLKKFQQLTETIFLEVEYSSAMQ